MVLAKTEVKKQVAMHFSEAIVENTGRLSAVLRSQSSPTSDFLGKLILKSEM